MPGDCDEVAGIKRGLRRISSTVKSIFVPAQPRTDLLDGLRSDVQSVADALTRARYAATSLPPPPSAWPASPAHPCGPNLGTARPTPRWRAKREGG